MSIHLKKTTDEECRVVKGVLYHMPGSSGVGVYTGGHYQEVVNVANKVLLSLDDQLYLKSNGYGSLDEFFFKCLLDERVCFVCLGFVDTYIQFNHSPTCLLHRLTEGLVDY